MRTWILALTLCLSSNFIAFASDDKAFADGIKAYKECRYRAAANKFQEAFEKGNGSPEVYLYWAHSLAGCGEKGKAIKKYQDTATVFKGLPPEKVALQCVKRLDPYNQHKNVNPTEGIAEIPKVQPKKAKGSVEERPEDTATKPDDPNDLDDVLPEEEHVFYSKDLGQKPVVKGFINGKPYNLVIDTGAYRVVVGKRALSSLNIKVPSDAPKSYSYGAGGKFYHWTMPLEISVGKIKRKLKVHVSENDDFVCLGQPFLRNLVYHMDNSRGLLIFHNNSEKAKKQLALDTIEIPFHMKDGNMMVDIKVEGKPLEANFDTGAPCIMLAYDKAKEYGLLSNKDVGRTTIQGFDGKQSVALYCVVDTVDLGPIRKSKILVFVGGTTVIGQTFFSDKRYVIDNEKKVIRFMRR